MILIGLLFVSLVGLMALPHVLLRARRLSDLRRGLSERESSVLRRAIASARRGSFVPSPGLPASLAAPSAFAAMVVTSRRVRAAGLPL